MRASSSLANILWRISHAFQKVFFSDRRLCSYGERVGSLPLCQNQLRRPPMKSLVLITSVMMLATGSANAQTPAVGQQTAAPTATQHASAASREVAAAAAAIVDAFGRHDPKKYFSLFAPDATFVFHTTPKRLNARAEYEAEWAMWEKEDGFRVRSCKSIFLGCQNYFACYW